MENKIFKYALLMSLAVHSFILTVLWLTDIRFQQNEQQQVMEIVYQAVSPEHKAAARTLELKRTQEQRKSNLSKPLAPADVVKMQPAPVLDKAPARLDSLNKSVGRLYEPGEKRQIRIPVLDSDKMMGSRYLTYHEQVREKIRNRAYFYVDDPRFETGEVYLTFILGSDGVVKDVKIIEDRTRANHYLRNIGLRSIKETSPFPPFPQDLNYPELTFNVVISFEVGE